MISTVAGLLVALVVVAGIRFLYRFWFLGPNPLERNTSARVEAGQKPEVLRDLYREYQRRRVVGGLAILTFVYMAIALISLPAANRILDTIWFAARAIFGFLEQVGAAALELVRSLL